MERDGKDQASADKSAAALAGESNVKPIRRRKSAAEPPAGRRGGPARSVAELVPQIGRTAFNKFGFIQSSVVMRWGEIVGAHHARMCAPESIRFPRGEKRGGTLNLVVEPAHGPLIQHVVPEIIERVNRFFGYQAVAAIRMRQGPVQPVHGDRVSRQQPEPLSSPVELGESLRDIGDPELRTVLQSLARSLLRGEQDKDGGK